ncbi:hypothetical protein [Mucilaginibacter sp. FT3.2]|uniref:hypothetical protein n=1 Tax=Mucilaginibacter sp. FT3.2 TaxID=2723090 RepID=UPI0016102C9F|nr:hypothetical protein [Mucilaginibacter sp. FT3.2]MBB6233725.1 hypothetical protein [Mucilaginibacter sp. FT3.2]
MKYADWKSLTTEERKAIGWHKHPHIKTATLYGIAFAAAFIIVIFGISKNSSVHLNLKPSPKQAFEASQIFVKAKLPQPSTADFPDNSFTPVIDTAANSYQIQSTVKSIAVDGKTIKSQWIINMHYKGGDWSEANSWQVDSINIK